MSDKLSEPCLIHCALSKDGTGIPVALILCLAGFSKHEIAREYALTNLGIVPYRPVIEKLVKSFMKDNWNENKVAAVLPLKCGGSCFL